MAVQLIQGTEVLGQGRCSRQTLSSSRSCAVLCSCQWDCACSGPRAGFGVQVLDEKWTIKRDEVSRHSLVDAVNYFNFFPHLSRSCCCLRCSQTREGRSLPACSCPPRCSWGGGDTGGAQDRWHRLAEPERDRSHGCGGRAMVPPGCSRHLPGWNVGVSCVPPAPTASPGPRGEGKG